MVALPKPSHFQLLVVVVIIQVFILCGEYLNSVYPLWTGQKVQLAISPVDPRSFFRGNYARLNYDIANIEADLFDPRDLQQIKRGSILYVTLEEQNEIWIPRKASLGKPKQGVFIRGRVQSKEMDSQIRMKYGIEAYFAPIEKAQALENDLRRTRRGNDDSAMATAAVMVASSGKAALLGVKVDNSVQ